MTWLDKLERRIGFLAVPGLLRYVGFLTALVFVLEKVNPGYLRLLDLDDCSISILLQSCTAKSGG